MPSPLSQPERFEVGEEDAKRITGRIKKAETLHELQVPTCGHLLQRMHIAHVIRYAMIGPLQLHMPA